MNLLYEINRFLRSSEMRPTRFGIEAVNDPRFVFDLRNGRETRPKTALRVRAYIEQQSASAPARA